MNNYEENKNLLYEAYNGYCSVLGCLNKADECHHILHNTEYNRKKFPLFINSVFNLKPVCRKHHKYYKKEHSLNLIMKLPAIYEEYLQKIKDGI